MSTLTIMTQILTNYEKAGNHVTAVDIWLFVCLIMVFLALMEYAVAYTMSHYYDGSDKFRESNSLNQNYSSMHKPLQMTSSGAYKQDDGPFFHHSQRSLFLRNRHNGASNQSPKKLSNTPAIELETKNNNKNKFKLNNLPLSPLSSGNSAVAVDPESGIASSELAIKGEINLYLLIYKFCKFLYIKQIYHLTQLQQHRHFYQALLFHQTKWKMRKDSNC